MSENLETTKVPRVRLGRGASLRRRWQNLRSGVERLSKMIGASYERFTKKPQS